MSRTLHRSLPPLLLAALLTISGCGRTAQAETDTEARSAITSQAGTKTWEVSEFYDAVYHPEQAEEIPGGGIDLSALEYGYIAVSVENEARLKLQIIQGDMTYNYDLANDGEPTVYPLNMGDGSYTIRVMENIMDDQYAELWSTTAEVHMQDEYQPFLRPSVMVNYSETSDCVVLAQQLAMNCGDDLAVASAVYDYLVEHISYDYEKAKNIEKGYLPNPDETLSSGTGICFDYAALTAAMLRSLDIPCQLITGYVGADALYHAWNRIYIQDQGWLTVEIKVSGDAWKRVDITFASTGTEAQTLENDGNYTTRYTY